MKVYGINEKEFDYLRPPQNASLIRHQSKQSTVTLRGVHNVVEELKKGKEDFP